MCEICLLLTFVLSVLQSRICRVLLGGTCGEYSTSWYMLFANLTSAYRGPNDRLSLPLLPVLIPWRILRSGTGGAGCRLYHSRHTACATAVHPKQTGALSMQAALVTLSPMSTHIQIQILCAHPCTVLLLTSSQRLSRALAFRDALHCTPLHAPVCQTRVLCVGTD